MSRTQRRGYGAAHQKLRAKVKEHLVDAGLAVCWRCTGWIHPDEPWDLGHDDQDRSLYKGPEHARCNRATSSHRVERTPRRWKL